MHIGSFATRILIIRNKNFDNSLSKERKCGVVIRHNPVVNMIRS